MAKKKLKARVRRNLPRKPRKLLRRHWQMLREESAISEEAIRRRGYRPILDKKELLRRKGAANIMRVRLEMVVPGTS